MNLEEKRNDRERDRDKEKERERERERERIWKKYKKFGMKQRQSV